jgi:hypothetical protein
MTSRVLLALAIVVTSSAARADQTTSALNWVRLPGTEGCLSASDLAARVEKRLGRSVFVPPGAADVAIEGRVELRPNKKGFRMVVRGVRRDGTEIGARELDSARPDCHALDDTVALVVALMIDPEADAPKPPPPAPDPPPPEREIVHERVIVHEVERPLPPAPPSRLLVDAYAAGTLAFGRVPGTAPGLALAVRIGPRNFPVEAALGTIPSGSLRSGDVSASYWLLEAGLAICPAVPLGEGGRIELGGCAGARIGNVRMRGDGFASNAEVDRPLVDASLGPRALVVLAPPVFAIAGVTAVVPFVRQRTTYTASDGSQLLLYERAAVGAEAVIGVGVRFSP